MDKIYTITKDNIDYEYHMSEPTRSFVMIKSKDECRCKPIKARDFGRVVEMLDRVAAHS